MRRMQLINELHLDIQKRDMLQPAILEKLLAQIRICLVVEHRSLSSFARAPKTSMGPNAATSNDTRMQARPLLSMTRNLLNTEIQGRARQASSKQDEKTGHDSEEAPSSDGKIVSL